MTFPLPSADLYVTDGGLETTLVFHEGIDLPDFAAFPLLDRVEGRAALRRYFMPYLDLARSVGAGIVLDTPTWRANPDWAARLGYDADRLAEINRQSVQFAYDLAETCPDVNVVVNGVIGPRGDGYVVGAAMSPAEAANYHALQARAFAEAGARMITAVTMTYAAEGIGVATAAREVGLPAVVSFTVETDGRLPSGQALADAVAEVDAATDSSPAFYMINCAHPTHFAAVLDRAGQWLRRIKAIRANASTLSHAELDAAPELDRGDPVELAESYARLRDVLPELLVVGGCCGTDHEHITAIVRTLTAART